MIIRIHMKRIDGFGEYRNYYDIQVMFDLKDRYDFIKLDGNKFYVLKENIVGLPEIVE